MNTHKGDPPVYQEVPVIGELTQQIADLIGHIKMSRGTGVKSKLNFCLYCYSILLLLPLPLGFKHESIYCASIFVASHVWGL